MSLKCYTAPGVVFESREALHAHYKTEWHRYNLKRKVASLPPIPKEMFDKLQLITQERERASKQVVKKKDHIKKDKRVDGEEPDELSEAPPAPPKQGESGSLEDAMEEEDEEGVAKKEDYEIDEEQLHRPVDVKVCFFDNHVSEDLESNLDYMRMHFGFMVPDIDYVINLEGFFKYSAQKVLAGKLCLYCDRPFASAKAAIQHMVAKSHCKIDWESEEAFEEYEEYYDFAPLEAEIAQKEAETEVEVLETGELIITDKKTNTKKFIGIRQFKNIYKQRHRPEDNRESVKAASKERLMLLYKRAGVDADSTDLARPMFYGNRPAWLTKRVAQQQRTDIHYAQVLRLKQGVQENLLTKNRLHQRKQMGAGHGVHG